MFGPDDPFYRFLNDLRTRGLEFVSNRFYAKYPATVVQNRDPQQQGRILVSVGSCGHNTITGSTVRSKTLDLYAYPSSPYAGTNYGFYFPPEEGEAVWVWFENGDTTQPHYSGGYWGNATPGDPASIVTKPNSTSDVPPEFNSMSNLKLGDNAQIKKVVVTSSAAPEITTRGIKTKRGHGLVFEDDAVQSLGVTTHGRETRVELWTGQPAQPASTTSNVPQPPVAAIQRHRFVMSDAMQNISVISCGPTPGAKLGHKTTWDDRVASQGVRTTTTGKHAFDMNDSISVSATGAEPKSIMIKTTLGHMIQASDSSNTIRFSTVGQNIIEMNDPAQTITAITKLKQFITMNDNALTTAIFTPGSFVENALLTNSLLSGGATFITAGATMTLTAGGILQITAQGINITSTGPTACATVSGGAVNNIFTGLVSETLNGGYSQDVTGDWDVTANAASLVTDPAVGGVPTLLLGRDGTKYYLVTEAFFDIFNSHSHPAPGAPPLEQIVPPTSPTQPIPDPLIVAPDYDERLFLTQDIQGS